MHKHSDQLVNQSINQSILSLRFNGHFPTGPNLADTRMSSFWILLELGMMEVVVSGNNWRYKSCKAPVKSSSPTNQHPVFLQAGCLSCHPTNSVKALRGSMINWTISQPASQLVCQSANQSSILSPF